MRGDMRAAGRAGRRAYATTVWLSSTQLNSDLNGFTGYTTMGNTFKTALLLTLLSGVLLVIGQSIGGQTGLMFAFVIAVVMNVGSYWFSDRIVLRMYKAQEVEPDHPLNQMTARLAQRANLPPPKVYVISTPSPNAFATGRNPQHAAVAATEGIIQLLDDREFEGVIAHELAHVKHRDILISSVAATVAATIMMVARMAQFAAIFGGFGGRADRQGSNPIAFLATIILAPLAPLLIQAAISRSREFAADRGAAEIVGAPHGPGRCTAQDRRGGAPGAAECAPGDGAHVYHEAVLGSRHDGALQYASGDRAADPASAPTSLAAYPCLSVCC